MKKITALIMMAIMITIGGVYAAWVYDDGAPDSLNQSKLSVIIPSATTTGKSGILEMDSNLVTITIDDIDDGTKYNAVLTCTGSISITFKPSVNAGADTRESGIRIKLTPTVENSATYNEITIISTTGEVYSPAVGQSGDSLETASERELGEYVKDGDGNFVWTLSSTDILSLLQLGDGDPENPFILDTSAKHRTFMEALAGHHNIKFKVEEVIA